MSRWSHRTWARATAASQAAPRTAATTASSSTPRAPPAPATGLRPARRSSRTSAAGELHRQPGGRVHLHRRARRDGLRLRAPVRRDHARARRRRTGGAPGEPGLPAPRRLPGRHPDHERGRLLRRRRAFRCSTRGEQRHGVAARAARELPLQRVRPHVPDRHFGRPRPHRPAPESQRAEPGREPDRELRRLHVGRHRGLSPERQADRGRPQVAQERSEPGVRRRDTSLRRHTAAPRRAGPCRPTPPAASGLRSRLRPPRPRRPRPATNAPCVRRAWSAKAAASPGGRETRSDGPPSSANPAMSVPASPADRAASISSAASPAARPGPACCRLSKHPRGTGALCTSSCTTTADCATGTIGDRNDPERPPL